MSSLVNSYEGGSDGTDITTGNSGGASGNAFNFVNTGAGTVKYSTAQAAHGSVSGKCSTTGTADTPYKRWTSGVSNTTVYGRAYFYLPSIPGSNTRLIRFLSGSSTSVAAVRVNSTGKLAFIYGSSTVGGTSSASVNTAGWFRVEIKVVASTTAGSVEVRLYNTPDSSTATETLSVSGVNTGTDSAVDGYRVGILDSISNFDVYDDDMAFGDVDWFGPATSTTTLNGYGVPTDELFGNLAVGTSISFTGFGVPETGLFGNLTVSANDIRFAWVGPLASNSSTPSPRFPNNAAEGEVFNKDLALLVVVNKPDTATVDSSPAGFTLLGTGVGGTGTSGSDTGPVRITVFYRVCDGSENGYSANDLSVTGGTGVSGTILGFRFSGLSWGIAWAGVGSDVGLGTNHEAYVPTNIPVAKDDFLVSLGALMSDAPTFTGCSTIVPGCSLGTFSERLDAASTANFDHRVGAYTATVDSGQSSGVALVSFMVDANATGAVALVRLRELFISSPPPPRHRRMMPLLVR